MTDHPLETAPPVVWVTVDDVAVALGPTATVDDAWLAMVTDAANEWAFRKRREAGYIDDAAVVPGADAKLGTVLYAVAAYRERASVDSFSSFSEYDGGTAFGTFGSMGQIKRLLGIGKANVDVAPADVVTSLRRHPSLPRGSWRR